MRYIVERALDAASENVKEYLIGVEVFDRGDAFDPRTDTIVRVQARRLRDRLADYYAGEGRADPIVIKVPKGGYVPEFRRPPPARSAMEAAVRTFPQPSQREVGPSPKPALVKTLPRRGEALVLPEGEPERSGSPDLIFARVLGGREAAGQSILVGREKELAALQAGLQQVLSGQSLLIGTAGEAGIGKTSLVEVFLHQIASRDRVYSIARGQCSERLAGTEAYLPFFDLLGSLLQYDGQVARLMREQAPWWYAQVASLSMDNPRDERILNEVRNATQERVKRELASFLQEVSRLRPLLLFIEDLHWADVSTIDMLAYLGSKFDSMRLLIVTAYRPSEMVLADHPFLHIKSDLLTRGRCREIELRFLTEDDIERYLSLKYSGHEFSRTFVKLIHQRTEGSPLFMVDLLRDLQDRSVIAEDGGEWRLAQSVSQIRLELPGSVKGMIQRKIAQLSKEDHRLLATASVQGFAFDSSVVAQMLARDEETVEERLQVLESDHRFVQLMKEEEFPDHTVTLRYRFVHVPIKTSSTPHLRGRSGLD